MQVFRRLGTGVKVPTGSKGCNALLRGPGNVATVERKAGGAIAADQVVIEAQSN